jgi:hypothetical protein
MSLFKKVTNWLCSKEPLKCSLLKWIKIPSGIHYNVYLMHIHQSYFLLFFFLLQPVLTWKKFKPHSTSWWVVTWFSAGTSLTSLLYSFHSNSIYFMRMEGRMGKRRWGQRADEEKIEGSHILKPLIRKLWKNFIYILEGAKIPYELASKEGILLY